MILAVTRGKPAAHRRSGAEGGGAQLSVWPNWLLLDGVEQGEGGGDPWPEVGLQQRLQAAVGHLQVQPQHQELNGLVPGGAVREGAAEPVKGFINRIKSICSKKYILIEIGFPD